MRANVMNKLDQHIARVIRTDPTLSAIQTAATVLGETPTAEYFARQVTNLAFHQLMEHDLLPPEAEKLLGLGKNFIPTPPFTTSQREMASHLHRFRRDFSLRVHYSVDKRDDEVGEPPPNSKLYLKSTWEPDTMSGEILARLESFLDEV